MDDMRDGSSSDEEESDAEDSEHGSTKGSDNESGPSLPSAGKAFGRESSSHSSRARSGDIAGHKRSRAGDDASQSTNPVAATSYARTDGKKRGVHKALDARRTYEKHIVMDPSASMKEARDILDKGPQAASSSASADVPLLSIAIGRWERVAKHVFLRDGARINSAYLHSKMSMLVVGFSDGVFGLYSLPTFKAMHTLSIASAAVTASAINVSGEWLAFGSAEHG